MLNQERKNKILEIIEEKGAVSVSELTEMLNASESTIRRDLIELSKRATLIECTAVQRCQTGSL